MIVCSENITKRKKQNQNYMSKCAAGIWQKSANHHSVRAGAGQMGVGLLPCLFWLLFLTKKKSNIRILPITKS
jgi:hypothetical protein